MIVDISKLKINPFHSQIYQINDIDDLIESIQQSGLLVPIVVNKQFVIISGFRRYLALKKLEYTEVQVEIKDCDENDELLLLISYNKKREKTNREILNEAKYLKEIWGQKRGRKSDDEKLENSEPVDTRKKISGIMGISAGNLSKLPVRTIITPKQNESIVDIIFKNFDQTCNFLGNVR